MVAAFRCVRSLRRSSSGRRQQVVGHIIFSRVPHRVCPHDAHLESQSGQRWSAEKANGGRDAMPDTRFGKWRGDGRSVRSKFGWRREARKDVAGSKTVAPSAPTFWDSDDPAVRRQRQYQSRSQFCASWSVKTDSGESPICCGHIRHVQRRPERHPRWLSAVDCLFTKRC